MNRHLSLFMMKQGISSVQVEMQQEVENTLSFDGPPDSMITVAGKTYLYFAGTGYLGLQADPHVLAATCEAVLRYGVGTATSRMAFTSPPVYEVERRVSEMLGTERAFYTASGYIANQILLEALEGTFDRIFIDESAHYSLFDATKRIRANRCRPITFRNGDVDDLREKLDNNLRMNERPIILTDGVFSFLGKVAPIRQYTQLLAEYEGASVLIDDAHGFGVIGNCGLGTLEYEGFDVTCANRTPQDANDPFDVTSECENEPNTKMFWCFSMSKAIGGGGGMIPGSESFVQRIKERSSVFFGASAPACPVAAATAKSLSRLSDHSIRERLMKNTVFLRTKIKEMGIEMNVPPLPMTILRIGSAGNMRRIQRELSDKGILISYLPRHAGLGSQGALRIVTFATHTETMISELCDILRRAI
ncbi:MAG: aminotransferase class I/II-fold pyridoxal phosphate-dependent enzyme [Thermoguttaceae bacterium]